MKGMEHENRDIDRGRRGRADAHPHDHGHPHEHAHAYTGHCFCGAVEISVTGDPVGMGYCHCEHCRSWSAGPVNAFTLWPPEAVEITKGADKIATFHKTDNSHRMWCTVCGGHLMTEHPQWKLVDVYAATIPDLPFRPGAPRQLREHGPAHA